MLVVAEGMMSLIVLVVGVVLIVIAGIVIAGFVVRSRRGRQHHKQLDRGEEGAVQRKDKRNGHKVDTIRDSLLDRHNYEEVSEDGLSGPDSKSLHSKQQPNYSHMPDKGHSRQASGASSPHAAEQQRLEDADEDNYNKLNLQASARSQGAQAAPRPKPQPATNAAEDDDYMEIGGDDIYEAVDDDGTPLCPRRKRRSQSPREDYTDCVSSNDLADKGGSASTHVVFLGKQQQQPADVAPKASSSSPGSRKEQNKPDPPRSAPPSHVRHSKSAEDLAADRPEVTKPPSKHKQSNSVDLRKMQSDYQNAPFFTPGAQQTNPNAAASPGPPARDATTRKPFTTTKSLTDLNAHSDEPPYSNTRVPEADLRRQQPSGTTAASDSNPDSDDPSHVVLRPKSRAPKPSTEGPSLLDHLKDTNPGLLAFQESMRSSMEINDEELVMIDNVLYGIIPLRLNNTRKHVDDNNRMSGPASRLVHFQA
nr:hypothetical protein BaRGS_029520 [Batillaria attramentaria]